MRKTKFWLIVILFILVLVGFRLLWIESNQTPRTPLAQNGVLDLRDSSGWPENLLLNGEWAFYAEEFLQPGTVDEHDFSVIQVPSDWSDQFSGGNSYGYGTYRLKILLDQQDRNIYRLYAKDIVSASRFFVNGKEQSPLGQPATSQQQERVDYRPQMIQLEAVAGEIELLIHVSNFHSIATGGLLQPMRFGEWTIAERFVFKEYAWQLILIAILSLHSLYSLLIFALYSRKNNMLYLSLSFLFMALTITISDDKLLLYFFPAISFAVWSKLNVLLYIGAVYLIVMYIKSLVDTKDHPLARWTKYFFLLYTAGFAAVVLLTLFSINIEVLFIYALMIILPLPLPFLIYSLSRHMGPNFIFFFLAAIGLISSTLWGLYKAQVLPELPYYPFDMLISIILFGLFWFKGFFMEKDKSQRLAVSLQNEIMQKDNFLANTSHELRNPLHGIMNITQTIHDSNKETLTPETKRNLDTLLSVGRQMTTVLNDLLDREKLKEGKLHLDRHEIKVLPVLENVIETLQFMTQGKSLVLEHSLTDQFPYVQADENRLYQIFFNLLHNAIKFSSEGMIHVSAEVKDGMAVIHIADEGMGMSKEESEKIFHAYMQTEKGMTSTGGGGLGLGLSICRQLIELHGGTIKVKTAEGHGSTFTFTLPLAEGQTQKVAPPAVEIPHAEPESVSSEAVSPGDAGEHILVVDDDPLNLQIIKQMLVAEGFTATICTSGKEALERLESGKWSLVISDVMMPYMSGYELTRELRKQLTLAELPILLLTARTQPVDIQMGFEAGANDYVSKPVEKVELMIRVRALLELNHTIAERIEMEAAWLQAQIQPHFLFNTLNTISALSEIDPDQMVKLLENFGTYLEQSFTSQNLERTVPLKKELELVEAYIYIEKQRYGDRLQIKMDIDPVEVEVPPLSIQTLVENAMEHGVLKRPEGGTVWLSVKENEDAVEITIRDSGSGMERDIDTLLRNDNMGLENVGIPNTHKRLRQLGHAGLEIESIAEVGTVVRFSIKK